MSLVPEFKNSADIEAHLAKVLGRLEQGKQSTRTYNTFGKEQSLHQIVDEILAKVEQDGDLAVAEILALVDKVNLSPQALVVSPQDFKHARESIVPEVEESLQLMARRIESYAQAMLPQKEQWFDNPNSGRRLGVRFTPIESIGFYVPGGMAGSTPLISTVLMNILPARVAGVKKIVVATPCGKDGWVHPVLLRACEIAEVDVVYRAGGAQAVAAMCFGTQSCPRCRKVVGPGNSFVQLAKQKLYGRIDIDMMAGPSEIAIVADESARAAVVAADLIAQAEHDKEAASVLFTPSLELLNSVQQEIEKQLGTLPRQENARQSLKNFGALCLVSDLNEAARLVNLLAPEHLELLVHAPHELSQHIQNAGAIFFGHHTPEVLGDYTAGPSHTLPTCGAAAFSSGVTVYTFLKSSSLIEYDKIAFFSDLPHLARIARLENLEAHALSGESRIDQDEDED